MKEAAPMVEQIKRAANPQGLNSQKSRAREIWGGTFEEKDQSRIRSEVTIFSKRGEALYAGVLREATVFFTKHKRGGPRRGVHTLSDEEAWALQ